MSRQEIEREYRRWLARADADASLAAELRAMDDGAIEDAFYQELSFGTGGLRGVMGAGTNRMNGYTVAKASQGLANFLKRSFPEGLCSVAVAYDSRKNSKDFAKTACAVFAANGLRAWIYPRLMPTPCLSYAVRFLGCSAGVVITASHNPRQYNGYKVYDADGCQITTAAADAIFSEIKELDVFDGVQRGSFEEGLRSGDIQYIPEGVLDAYIEEVKTCSVLYGDAADRRRTIVYSPLNGTGREPVLRTLRELGFSDIQVVAAQEMPDGDFPSCSSPNPEESQALELGIRCAQEVGADLVIATDPDCDRVGIAVRNQDGEYVLLSGNETGLLLLDFICSQRKKHGRLPAEPVAIKSIVTTELGEQIAERYGVQTCNVLTGFKYIGEQIGRLEKQGQCDCFIFGYEESHGYLTGTYVRDKDGVGAAAMICEMYGYYAAHGTHLLERLKALYQSYGYCRNVQHSYRFYGSAGLAKMQAVMQAMRANVDVLGGRRVVTRMDYAKGLDGLPKSNVLKLLLEDGSAVIVRPSGTEPKLKAYVSVIAESSEAGARIETGIIADLERIVSDR